MFNFLCQDEPAVVNWSVIVERQIRKATKSCLVCRGFSEGG
jgi:hypothetical protein